MTVTVLSSPCCKHMQELFCSSDEAENPCLTVSIGAWQVVLWDRLSNEDTALMAR